MLASIGGRYTWLTLPCLMSAAGLFLLSGARVGADPPTRAIDLALIAALAVIALQMVPLPPTMLHIISPATANLQDAYALEPFEAWRPVSIHPAATRSAFALALAAAFVFWASREAFSHGGTRAAIRLLAGVGFVCALASLAQRATAPKTVFWMWSVPDPRAAPFGPFVDRNQLATWLVLTMTVVAGYLAMRVSAHMADRMRHGSRAALVALFDGSALAIAGCLAAMLITLAATLSRSGLIAIVASAIIGTSLSRQGRTHGVWIGVGTAAAVFGVAAWLNVQGLAERVMATFAAPDPNAVSRLVIWRDTMRIIRDFPVFGTGAGTFADAMFVYQQTARQVLFNHAHDEYLQILTEGGLMLMAIVLLGAISLTRAARVRLAADDGPHRFIRIAACAALAAVAVQSVWETGLRAPANLLLAAIVAALAVRPMDRAPSAPPERPRAEPLPEITTT